MGALSTPTPTTLLCTPVLPPPTVPPPLLEESLLCGMKRVSPVRGWPKRSEIPRVSFWASCVGWTGRNLGTQPARSFAEGSRQPGLRTGPGPPAGQRRAGRAPSPHMAPCPCCPPGPSSKFRHAQGTVLHRDSHITNLKGLNLTTPGESDGFCANWQRVAMPLLSSGGQVAVLEVRGPTLPCCPHVPAGC